MQTAAAGSAEITGGIGATDFTAGSGGTLRQFTAAMGADAAGGIVYNFNTAVRTTHGNSSFFLHYKKLV